jgi:hypothetical protein
MLGQPLSTACAGKHLITIIAFDNFLGHSVPKWLLSGTGVSPDKAGTRIIDPAELERRCHATRHPRTGWHLRAQKAAALVTEPTVTTYPRDENPRSRGPVGAIPCHLAARPTQPLPPQPTQTPLPLHRRQVIPATLHPPPRSSSCLPVPLQRGQVPVPRQPPQRRPPFLRLNGHIRYLPDALPWCSTATRLGDPPVVPFSCVMIGASSYEERRWQRGIGDRWRVWANISSPHTWPLPAPTSSSSKLTLCG